MPGAGSLVRLKTLLVGCSIWCLSSLYLCRLNSLLGYGAFSVAFLIGDGSHGIQFFLDTFLASGFLACLLFLPAFLGQLDALSHQLLLVLNFVHDRLL